MGHDQRSLVSACRASVIWPTVMVGKPLCRHVSNPPRLGPATSRIHGRRRMAGQAFALHEKLVAPPVSLGRMDGAWTVGSRVDDCDRYFSRAGRGCGGRGVLERPPVAGPAGPARASGTALPGPLAVKTPHATAGQPPTRRTARFFIPPAVTDAPLSRTHSEIDEGPAASGRALVFIGFAGRTRTCDMVVNSQSSYHAASRTVYAFLQIP